MRTVAKMAHGKLYLFCLFTVAASFIVDVNGQYYHHPKEYLKQSILAPTSLKLHSRVNEVHNLAEAAARSTLFEPLVTDILDIANGDLGDILELSLNENVSLQCRQDFNEFMLNLQEPYALSMLDAAGKFPSGLLQGNIMWHGRFDECRAVKADDTHDFNGRYCLTTLNSYKPGAFIPQIHLGVCVPDSCSSEDVDILISTSVLEMPLEILEYFPYTICAIDPEYSAGAIVALCIFSILGLLIVCGTGLEVSKYFIKVIRTAFDSKETYGMQEDAVEPTAPQESMAEATNSQIQNENLVDVSQNIQLLPATESKSHIMKWAEKFLLCFSALTNGKKIMVTETAAPNRHLAALNGIRVISMFWVILGHVHLFITSSADNPASAYTIFQRFSFQAISNATFSVDSFFVLSGLLVTYFALKELKAKNGRLNWGLFYFHRFWRLTPVYMLTILLWTTLMPHFTNGPQYFALYKDTPGQPPSAVTTCKKYWWTNLLYINNLYPQHLGTECLGWSWYLANDMQFYVISPIILYLLHRYKHIGFGVISTLMAVCFTCNAVIAKKYDLSPGVFQPSFHNNTVANADDFIYVKPWTRINSYLVGMMTGYMLYWLHGRSWRMPPIVTILGWCYAIATGLGMVYCLYGTFHGRYQTQPQAVFYYTVSRTLWSSAVAWVAFACATGYGGPVNALLGWAAWGPLARLTYCAYLLHPIIIYVYYLSAITPFHYTDYTMIYMYLGNLVLAYAAAFVMSVCAEAPFMALEKLLLPKRGVPQEKQKPPDHSTC